MKYLLPTLLLILILTSCKKDNPAAYDNLEYPTSTDSLDFDLDGLADFYIRYYQISTLDIPVSASTVTAAFVPVGSNEILTQPESSSFFLTTNDTIRNTDNQFQWSEYSVGIISNSWNGQSWDKYWTVNSDKTDNFYLGYKIDKGYLAPTIGWVKFGFNLENGTYSILSINTTNEDWLRTGY